MALQVDRTNGQNYAENIIDPILLFESGTWTTASGTGTATLDTLSPFVGGKCLKIENNVPTSTYTATNSTQSTNVQNSGAYTLSFYARKDIGQEVRSCSVLIYKNASLLNTQSFEIGNTDASLDRNNQWVRFQSSVSYGLIEGDVITFQFRLNLASTIEPTTYVYFDGIMLNPKGRGNSVVPHYTKPVSLEESNQYTGWGSYSDTQYTDVSPLSLTGGSAYINLPNDALNSLETQLPIDVTTFYDGSVVTGRNGDGLNVTLSFAVKPTTNIATRVTVVPDIGGAVGEIEDYAVDVTFSKGLNIVQRFLKAYDAYTLDTWEANGATLKIKADQDCEIYDIRYLLTRTHKAR